MCDSNPFVPSSPIANSSNDLPKERRKPIQSTLFPKDAPSLFVTGVLDGVPVYFYN